MEVKFHETIDDSLLKFADIISKSCGKWVFGKHKERDTYEVPGGHREKNESILETAIRELYEETGAVDYDIESICVYSVTGINKVNKIGEETFGMLYFADIKNFENELHSEMEKVDLLVVCVQKISSVMDVIQENALTMNSVYHPEGINGDYDDFNG